MNISGNSSGPRDGPLPRKNSALSPVSVAGSDWSGISRYQSVQSNGSDGYNNYGLGGGGGGGGGMNGSNPGGPGGGMGPPSRQNTFERNNPAMPPPGGGGYDDRGPGSSPPSSIGRSSDGGGLYQDSGYNSLKGIVIEEELAIHHAALKRLLAQDLLNDRNPKQKRARDKLLRLSKIQFQELSTDVYDELQRRQLAIDRRDSGQPPYLLPKESFHPKRNQARMKLSTLPVPRFRDLAKDVFYELERRFPQFASPDDTPLSPTGSMTSMRSFPQPPGRMGSPGPGRIASPGPNGMRNGPPQGYPQPGPGGPGGPGPGPGGPNTFGRPLPKTFQSNTIIPNKSTMVEEDDDDPENMYGSDGTGTGEDRDRLPGMMGRSGNSDGSAPMRRESSASSARNRAGSMKSLNGSINASGILVGSNSEDKQAIADYKSQISSLQQKLEDLEITLREKEAEAIRMKDEEMQRESSMLQERKMWEEDKSELDAKIASLESLNQQLQEDIERVKADYEAKENSLLDQIDQTNQQLDEMNQRLIDTEEELSRIEKQGRPRNDSTTIGAGDGDYAALLKKHEQLKQELKEQQEVTEEVQREATEFLKEMKALSERSAESWEREERLTQQVNKLQDEVKEWKSRYARAKAQLRTIRAASMGLALQGSVSLASRDGGFTDPNGIIKDIHVTRFQIAIDDLLRTARSAEPAQVLDYMKAVVVATRAISQEVDQALNPTDPSNTLSNADVVAKLKSRVSATANNLITAAKNHATANGLSPVSLLDAAASHLTASMIELVKVVKLKPTPRGELEEVVKEMIDEEPESQLHSRQFSVASSSNASQAYGNQNQISSPDRQRTATPVRQQQTPKQGQGNGVPRMSTDSNYSPLQSPRQSTRQSQPRGPGWSKREGLSMMSPPRDLPKAPVGFGIRTMENNVEELRIFVENQFEGIVENIQSLLDAIRNNKDIQTLRDEIFDIADVVGKVVDSTRGSMSLTGNLMLREKGEGIVMRLAECRGKMVEMADEGEGRLGSAGKDYKGKLAGLAYDMAREIKELVKTVEDIDTEARQATGMDAAVHEYMRESDDLR